MIIRFVWFNLIGICFACQMQASVVVDSISVVTRKLVAGVNSTFVNSSNWKGSTVNTFSVSVDADYLFNKISEKSTTLFSTKTEIGYTKFIDSIWNKHADKLNSQLIWKQKKKRLDSSFSAALTAQLLNSYLYDYDPTTNKNRKQRTGGFFNPASFETGFGFGITFWNTSIFNLSLASARILIDPNNEKTAASGKKYIGAVDKGVVLFDYGCSMQILALKELYKKVEINSSSKFFVNGFDKYRVQLDMVHKFNYSIWKWLQVRADIKIVYDPLFSTKLQYRNELLFGVFYDSTKRFE